MEKLKFHISELLEYFTNEKRCFKDAYSGGSFFNGQTLTIKSELFLKEEETEVLIREFLFHKKKKLSKFSLTRDALICYVEDLVEKKEISSSSLNV